MKAKLVAFALFVMSFTAGAQNLITNGNFSNGLTGWSFNSATVSVENGALRLTPINNSGQTWQKNISIQQNKAYTVKFKAKSSRSGEKMEVAVIQHVSPYTNYGLKQEITLGTEFSSQVIAFTATKTASDARFRFWFTNTSFDFFVDDVEFYESPPLGPRARPRTDKGQVRTAEDRPIMGDMVWLANWEADTTNVGRRNFWANDSVFAWWVDSLRLNALRLCLYRYPMGYINAGNEATYIIPGYIPNATRSAQTRNDSDWGRHFRNQVAYDTNHVKKLIDHFVEQTEKFGMYLMIDYHPVHKLDTVDWYKFWGVVAPRYANKTHVFYEVLNEPGSNASPSGFAWGRHGTRIRGTRGPSGPTTIYPYQAGWMTGWQKRMHAFIRARAPQTLMVLCTFASPGAWDSTTSGSMTPTMYVKRYLMQNIFGPPIPQQEWLNGGVAIGFHGSGTTRRWFHNWMDSVKYGHPNGFAYVNTENMYCGATEMTYEQTKKQMDSTLFGNGSDFYGDGYIKLGHSFFVQNWSGFIFTQGLPGNPKNWHGRYGPWPSNGRVLLKEWEKGTWPKWEKDPFTRVPPGFYK